jgi:hypothetical protein
MKSSQANLSQVRQKSIYHLQLFGLSLFGLYTLVGIIILARRNFFAVDIQQDYIGALALVHRGHDLYPILGSAFTKIGLNWNLNIRSTHPPTAFLFALPLILFNYKMAQVVWMAAMLGCLALTAHNFGLSWKKSILTGLISLLWPPTFWSLFQITPIWLLGVVLAFRYRHNAFKSGILIGFASLPKYLAFPTILYHLKRRKWMAFIGFCVTWLIALGLLLLLRPNAVIEYFKYNISNSFNQILKPDNGALLVVAWRFGGWIGISAILILVIWISWVALHHEGPFEWAYFVWLGIALLPIAWNYSLLPLLPWLILSLRRTRIFTRILVYSALILPYCGVFLGISSITVALSIIISGIAFLSASEREMQDTMDYSKQRGKMLRTPDLAQ